MSLDRDMNNVFINLPQSWECVTIGDFSKVTKLAGFEFTSHFNYQEYGEVRVVRGLNVGFGQFKEKNFKYIDLAVSDALPRSQLKGGDLLITYVGTLGSVAILPEDDNRYHLGPNVGKISIEKEISDARFLMYFLLSPLGVTRIHETSKAVAQSSLSMKQIRLLDIPLPPLNEQRRIVSKIEQLTDRSHKARTALADVPKLIEQFRQSVLAAAFRGDLTADWREKNPDVEPASELLERIKIDRRKRWEEAELEKMRVQGKEPKDDKWKKRYSDPKVLEIDDLPDIPDTWTWVNVDQVSWQVTDGEHNQPRYESQGYPMLTAKHVRDGYVDMSVVQLISEDSFKKARFRCAPEENDLLIVSVGATTGRAAIVNGCNPFALVRSVLLVKTLIPSQFILNWIRSRWCQRWIANASGSTAQAHLYINDTKIMPVPLPPEKELEEIIRIVKVMFDKFDSLSILLTDNFEEINQLDRAILAKAFRGELVPQDPNDEPAAVLLERIRAEREQTSTPKQRGKTTRQNSSKQLSIEGIE